MIPNVKPVPFIILMVLFSIFVSVGWYFISPTRAILRAHESKESIEPATQPDCLHTYNMSFFSHSDRTIRSVFVGYPEKGMTVAKTVKAQREVSGEGDGVLSLISVQYIGCEEK